MKVFDSIIRHILTGFAVILILLNALTGNAMASGKILSISLKRDNFYSAGLYTNPDITPLYTDMQIKIRPYQEFRLSLKLIMEYGEQWIYYYPQNIEISQESVGGPIKIGLPMSVTFQTWNTLEWDLAADMEMISLEVDDFIPTQFIRLEEFQILGNRYDLQYVKLTRQMPDGGVSTMIIEDFDISNVSLSARGWQSTDINEYGFASEQLTRYMTVNYTEPTSSSNNQDQSYYYNYSPAGYYNYYSTPYYYNTYPYTNYYGNYGNYGGYYGSGYYGMGYYGAGSYGGYYGAGSYGGYYGGGFYGGLYGGGLYGGGLYGGYYGGFSPYGYGGLPGGVNAFSPLRNYFGGPINLYSGIGYMAFPYV